MYIACNKEHTCSFMHKPIKKGVEGRLSHMIIIIIAAAVVTTPIKLVIMIIIIFALAQKCS